MEDAGKPNHSVVLKQTEKQMNDYFDLHLKNKIKQDESENRLRESTRKQKLNETRDYQKLQMMEKDNRNKLKQTSDRQEGIRMVKDDMKNVSQETHSVDRPVL